MAVAIVADAHLGGPGGSASGLIRQLDELDPQRCQRLILLGDIFHVWVGLAAFETPEVRDFLAAVDRLRERGVTVDYVEGNRDFFLREGPYRRRFDQVVLETPFEAGGKRYLAVHGDGLNDRDRAYRFWRWLSKSLPVRWAMRALPAVVARGLIARTERRLARTNFKHKSRIPEESIRAFGERRLAEGFDGILLGHFHEPHRFAVGGGEVRLLDAWFRSRRIEWFGAPEGEV